MLRKIYFRYMAVKRKFLYPTLLFLFISTQAFAIEVVPSISLKNQIQNIIHEELIAIEKVNHLKFHKIEIIPVIPKSLNFFKGCNNIDLQNTQQKNESYTGTLIRVISCKDSNPQFKMNIKIKVKIWMNVIAAKNYLNKNHVIKADDLIFKNILILKDNDFFTNKDKLLNRKLSRSISKGKKITSRTLYPNWAIKKGDVILIEAATKKLKVTAKGQALQNGHIGEQIKVKNLESGKIISASVKNKSKVNTIF